MDAEHASSGNESSGGFDELDCQYTSPEREDYALSDRVVPVQQQQYPDKQGKMLGFDQVLQGRMTFPGQQWQTGFYGNTTETEDNDAYSCKYAQEVLDYDFCAIPDGNCVFLLLIFSGLKMVACFFLCL